METFHPVFKTCALTIREVNYWLAPFVIKKRWNNMIFLRNSASPSCYSKVIVSVTGFGDSASSTNPAGWSVCPMRRLQKRNTDVDIWHNKANCTEFMKSWIRQTEYFITNFCSRSNILLNINESIPSFVAKLFIKNPTNQHLLEQIVLIKFDLISILYLFFFNWQMLFNWISYKLEPIQ